MDIKKAILFGLLAFLMMSLFMKWQAFQIAQNPPVQQQLSTDSSQSQNSDVPNTPQVITNSNTSDVPQANVDNAIIENNNGNQQGQNILVETDVYKASISTVGGTITQLDLKNYPVDLKTPEIPYEMMQSKGPIIFTAQSGLIGQQNELLPNHTTQFQTSTEALTLQNGENSVSLELTWKADNGIEYVKRFVFHRNSYNIDIEYDINNQSSEEIQAFLYAQFNRNDAAVEQFGLFGQSPSFTGGAYFTEESKYNKVKFNDFVGDSDSLQDLKTNDGWVAIIQHYFVSAWMPENQITASNDENALNTNASYEFYTKQSNQGQFFQIGYKTAQPEIVPAGETKTIKTNAYIGPKDQDRLTSQKVDGLLLTVDYGFLTAIASPLFWVLNKIHNFIGNWGWAIIILTLMIKLIFFPLSAASYKSMARMRKFQPRLTTLRERYKGDRQKLNQEMMKLYKEEKINPMGGCLPILIQIPVFISLYWVLLESVELRQAPWVAWIQDLSQKDPFYVLPVIYGISMFVTQRLNPQPADPIQQKVMMAMPIMFSVLFLFFPAGLVLYWVVNNLLTIAQQWYINKKYAH